MSCDTIDFRLRQVDSIRWSLRQDGTELETDFEQLVQLSLATATSLAIAIPLLTVYPDPTLALIPFAGAFGDPDLLKRTDALLIALLSQREKQQCTAHPECHVVPGEDGAFAALKRLREQQEQAVITEEEALQQVTGILDGLCPDSDRFLRRDMRSAPPPAPAPAAVDSINDTP